MEKLIARTNTSLKILSVLKSLATSILTPLTIRIHKGNQGRLEHQHKNIIVHAGAQFRSRSPAGVDLIPCFEFAPLRLDHTGLEFCQFSEIGKLLIHEDTYALKTLPRNSLKVRGGISPPL